MPGAPTATPLSRRRLLLGAGALGAGGLVAAACGRTGGSRVAPGTGAARPTAVPAVLRFGVGPLLPTATDTKAAWEPFFAWLAAQLGTRAEVAAVDSWGGISVALGSDQLDVAWMGPFGYVLANAHSGAEAIATVRYDGRPVYHAIVVGRPGLDVNAWPEGAKGRSISFTEVSSTSGWLVPTFWFRQRGIDPKKFFRYSEGASHAANELAVASGQVDLATDFDRNRNAMIESGRLAPDATKVVWTSDPSPTTPSACARVSIPSWAPASGTCWRRCPQSRRRASCPATTTASWPPTTSPTSPSATPPSPSTP